MTLHNDRTGETLHYESRGARFLQSALKNSRTYWTPEKGWHDPEPTNEED